MVEGMRFYKEIDLQDSPIGKIPKDWKATKMGDVAHVKGRIGWRGLKASEYTTEGPYLIANKHLANNKIIWDKCDHLSEFRYTESSEIQLQINDAIISKDGTIGQPAFIDSLPDRATINSTMMLLRVKNNVLAPEFLFYFLQGPHFKRFLRQKISGTSIPHLFQRDMKELDFFIPSLAEQRGVVGVLGVVDSAIELVDRLIWKTERLKKGLMQTLLTRGIGHKEYKETPIGKTPKTWQTVKIGEVCNQRSEIIQPSGEGMSRFIGLEHVASGEITTHSYGSDADIRSSKFRFYPKDILYGKLRPYLDKAVLVNFDGICSTDLLALIARQERALPEFLVYVFHLSDFIKHAVATTTGTNHPRTSWKAISKFEFGLPPLPEQRRTAEILFTVNKKLDFERKEKARLERVKRGLMDLLLTGKVRVRVD